MTRELRNIEFSIQLSGRIESVEITFGGELAEVIAACDDAGHVPKTDGDCSCGWLGAVRAVEASG